MSHRLETVKVVGEQLDVNNGIRLGTVIVFPEVKELSRWRSPNENTVEMETQTRYIATGGHSARAIDRVWRSTTKIYSAKRGVCNCTGSLACI